MLNHKKRKFTSAPKNERYKSNQFEKSTFVHLGKKCQKSPVQSKARDVIRKYKKQLRQLEVRKLQRLVPSVQNNEENSEVRFLVFYDLTVEEFLWSSQ